MTDSVHGRGFRELLDAVPGAIVVDQRGNVVALSRQGEEMLGWTEADLQGEPLNRLIPPRFHDVSGLQYSNNGTSQESSPQNAPVSLFAQRRDGSEFPVEFTRSPLGSGGEALALVTIRDLTMSRRAQETLYREKEQASVTLASIGDGVITTDIRGMVTYLNPTAERLTGWRMTEALGQPLGTVLTLISDVTRQPMEDIPTRCLQEGRAVDLADGVLLLRRDGTEVAIADSAAPLRDRNGTMIGVVLVFHDVTERRRVARELAHEATHDVLTGLVSRKEFERRLAKALSEVEANVAEHMLCYLDLDRFKIVNDVCGHEAGDELLRTIGRLLSSRLRSCDTVGRLGGDEFGVILEHCSAVKAQEIAEHLRQAVDEFRYVSEGRNFSLGVSIGILPITVACERTADLLRAADNACYVAKDAGGNRVHLAEVEAAPDVPKQTQNRRITRLTRAVEENGFHLYAQAILPLAQQRTGRHRCEILLRLPDGEGGVETPDSFLPYAERYRLTPAIDRWVVRETVAVVGRWRVEHPNSQLPVCAINLSVSSLEDTDLVATIAETLALQRLPPDTLCFEIAEAAALGNFAQLVRLISEIRAVGCGVGLDDFGTGMTSFAHLKALPVDYVKIGGHYVRGVADDPVYGTLVGAVNQIGRIMGIATIAEEVDSEATLEGLRSIGVEYAQGYAVAPPMPLVDGDGNVALPSMQAAR